MKQIYSHYLNWEDYQNGMYSMKNLDACFEDIANAKTLLSDPKRFYTTMQKMVNDWPICTDVNLSNLGQNRKAWLGAAACNFKHKTPEALTRIAWNGLTPQQQKEANLAAKKIINSYEKKNSHAKTLFEY